MLRGVIATNVMSPPMRRLDAAETATIAAYLDRGPVPRPVREGRAARQLQVLPGGPLRMYRD
ncbi:hypothetical protein [Streptomyces sp. NBC_01102]|uniref:hypothetical protein n=1 Tax=Streptomyces sp. NBC_01102 TaxID=2903749 RepID=UPI00386A8EE1